MKSTAMDLAKDIAERSVGNVLRMSLRHLYTRAVSGVEIFKVYAVNADGTGFVMCSASYNLPPVLAYSPTALFTQPPFSADFERFLEGFDTQATYNRERGVTFLSEHNDVEILPLFAGNTTGGVPPLMRVSWGQETPFNDAVPNNVYAGCVATSGAQIMKHFAYPDSVDVILPAYTDMNGVSWPALDIRGYKYAWAHMLDSYLWGGGTESQRGAAADVTLHAGWAVEMGYRLSGSVANAGLMAPALINYFNYDEDCSFINELDTFDTYLPCEISLIIKNNITDGRPVIIGGAGHSFIAHGMDENGLVYYNFGYEGTFDGYYDVLRPASYRVESMSANISPPVTVPLKVTSLVGPDLLTLESRATYQVSISTIDDSPFSGEIALALCDEAGNIITVSTPERINAQINMTLQMTIDILGHLSINPRRLHLLAKNNEEDARWKRLRGLEGEGALDVSIIRAGNIAGLWLSAGLPEALTLYKDESFDFMFSVESPGESWQGYFSLAFINDKGNILHEVEGETFVDIEQGAVNTVSIQGALSETVQVGELYTLQVFYSTAAGSVSNGRRVLPGVSAEVNDTVTVLVKTRHPVFNDVVLMENIVFPDKLSARDMLTVEARILCVSARELNFLAYVSLNIINDDGIAFGITSSKSYPFDEGVVVKFKEDVNVNSSVLSGNYQLSLCIRRLDNNLKTEIIGVIDDTVSNDREIAIEAAIESEYVRLTKPICLNGVAIVGNELDVGLTLRLAPTGNSNEKDRIFMGKVYIYIDNGIYKYIINDPDAMSIPVLEYDEVNHDIRCNLSPDIIPGEYKLYVEAKDSYHPNPPNRVIGYDDNVSPVADIVVLPM